MREQQESERKKNGNIPKFICRTLVNHFRKHKYIFNSDPKLLKEVNKMINEEKKKYEVNKNANNTLDDLKKNFCICEGSSNPMRKSFLLRKTMNRILRTSLEELVIFNTQIELTQEYMIYLKTQALRCRNKNLMCRLKARWFINTFSFITFLVGEIVYVWFFNIILLKKIIIFGKLLIFCISIYVEIQRRN